MERWFAMDDLTIRFAGEDDCQVLLQMVREFAFFIDMTENVEATIDGLRQSLFVEKRAEVLFAEADGEIAGYLLFFGSFSTFQGRGALFIEDLYVRERYRNAGCGEAFMRFLANQAVERGSTRIEWCCLDWNREAIGFYTAMGAVRLDGLGVYRLEMDELAGLAGRREISGRQ